MIYICLRMVVLFLCCGTVVHGSIGVIPKRNNEVYHWEQQSAAAKYVDRKYLNSARNSSRRLHGRHVCTQSKVVMVPVKETQTYCKPMYQSYLRRCDKEGSAYCTGYRVVYELAYRHVQMLMPKTESQHTCCPGWTQAQLSSMDCKKAVCSQSCKNGGICTKPDHCSCPPGWTGKTCEIDVNECTRRNHGCEHECLNLPGSYKCICRGGFTLTEDRRSCEKISSTKEKSNENELSQKIEELQQRLVALEEWQRRMAAEGGSESRHPRDDRINSLSEQIAIIEETLDECACYKRNTLVVPPPQ